MNESAPLPVKLSDSMMTMIKATLLPHSYGNDTRYKTANMDK